MKRPHNKFRGVYLIQFPNGIKVGRTTNFNDRINNYIKPWCSRILSVYFLHTPHEHHVECLIKARFKSNIKSKHSSEFIVGVKIDHVVEVLNMFCFKRPKDQYIVKGAGYYKVENLSNKLTAAPYAKKKKIAAFIKQEEPEEILRKSDEEYDQVG